MRVTLLRQPILPLVCPLKTDSMSEVLCVPACSCLVPAATVSSRHISGSGELY